MKEKRTSVFENGLIWFGAAVSIAEIMTGTYFAPLGLAKGCAAILIGHIICWSVGIMAATDHYLLVGNSHMTNYFQAG